MDYVTYDAGITDPDGVLHVMPQVMYRYDPANYILETILSQSSSNTSLAFWLGREADEEDPLMPALYFEPVPPGGVTYSVCSPDENGRWRGHVENYQWRNHPMFCHPSECSTHRYTFWLGADGLNDEDY